jgi:hypothetical protein
MLLRDLRKPSRTAVLHAQKQKVIDQRQAVSLRYLLWGGAHLLSVMLESRVAPRRGMGHADVVYI